MRRVIFPILAVAFGAIAILLWVKAVRGQDIDERGVIKSETEGENRRVISADTLEQAQSVEAPNISFIESPSSTCYQPDPNLDQCYINWYYLSVSASPHDVVAMTVTLNQIGVVGRISGFFQTSMYVPHNMLGNGIKVACGPLGAGGKPNLGNAYAFTINARDSTNLTAGNYGTVYCPAFTH